MAGFQIPNVLDYSNIQLQLQVWEDRATMAEMAARSLLDRKVVGLNPAGSNFDRLVSITHIDGYIVSDKYDMEFPDTISRAPEVVSLPPFKGVIERI